MHTHHRARERGGQMKKKKYKTTNQKRMENKSPTENYPECGILAVLPTSNYTHIIQQFVYRKKMAIITPSSIKFKRKNGFADK